MTDRPEEIEPRCLSVKQAAAYVGESVGLFEKGVDDGIYPKPRRRGRRKIWDRKALDAKLDKDSGLAAESNRFDFRGRMKGLLSGKGTAAVHD